MNCHIVTSIGIGLVCLSCLDNPNFSKPKNLIPPDKMSLILSDLLVAKGLAKVSKKSNQSFLEHFSIKTLLKSEHHVDSLQFINSLNYYESQPQAFLKILEQAERVVKEKIK